MIPYPKGLVTGWVQSRVISGGGYSMQAETRRMRKECLRQRGHLVERLRAEKEHRFSEELRKVL